MHETVERLLQYAQQATRGQPGAIVDVKGLGIRLEESVQTITNWKSRGVSKDGALKAEAAFGCSATWILTGKGESVQESLSQWPFPRITLIELKGLPAPFLEIVENLALSFKELSQNVDVDNKNSQSPTRPRVNFTVHVDDNRGDSPNGNSDRDEAESPREKRPAQGRS